MGDCKPTKVDQNKIRFFDTYCSENWQPFRPQGGIGFVIDFFADGFLLFLFNPFRVKIIANYCPNLPPLGELEGGCRFTLLYNSNLKA